ncbi:MAG: class I SAM-dependent methyltransferase [Bacillales bacterium]|nr:class I SAM-dependent methyltransferase [Bacillales bacterium]
MDIKKENAKLIEFWDQMFKDREPMAIEKSDFDENDKLIGYLKDLGNKSENIMDIGTGPGYALLAIATLLDKPKKLYGIDASASSILLAQETALKSGLKGIQFAQKNAEDLKEIPPLSYDLIICSNTLDVVPYDTSKAIIEEIKRILKKGGTLLLKINFYLNKELIERLKMEEIDKNTYTMNGIIRGMNLTNEEWIKRFSGFSLIKTDEYERIPNGPKDRIIILKKE